MGVEKGPSGHTKDLSGEDATRPAGRIYVGVDLHKDFLQAAVMDDTGRLLSNTRVENNGQSIREFLRTVPDDAEIVIESSSVWYGAYLTMRDAGYSVVLSNPFRTKAIAHSRIKTDKIDARVLADLLRTDLIPACYIPPDEIVRLRRMVRHRKHLAKTRTTQRHRIHAVLLMDGIRIPGTPFSGPYVRRLRELDDYRVDNYLDIIEVVDVKIKEMDAWLAKTVRERDEKDARLLTSIPGISYYSALVIVSEIGDVSRFDDSHRLCSYAGLVPSVRSSGGTTYLGRITKRGSPLLRRTLIMCVHSHRVSQPDSNISRIYARISAKKGGSKAAVAAASKMLRVVYRVLTEGREYVPEGPDDSGGL